jgi:hypothetical protein
LVEVDGHKAATILLRETQWPFVAETIRELAKMDIDSILVTGDSSLRAAQLPLQESFSRLTLEQKIAVVRPRKQEGQRILFVGDGINDTAATAESHVAVAVGSEPLARAAAGSFRASKGYFPQPRHCQADPVQSSDRYQLQFGWNRHCRGRFPRHATSRAEDSVIAAWLGGSVFLQALLLRVHMDIGLGSSIQYYAGAAFVAALVGLLIDAGAMIGGMRLSSRIRGGLGEWASLTQHLTMLGGMTIGMMLGMWIRYATFESRALQSPIQAVRQDC